MTTILLTGLPRAGTTLVCSLLNNYADTLALAEPLELSHQDDPDIALLEIAAFIEQTRIEAIQSGTAVSKNIEGIVPSNTIEETIGLEEGRRRRVVVQHSHIAVKKPLSKNFYLVIKHPAEFTALADRLNGRFPLYAILRNPLAVLAAWQTVEIPVYYGHMPMMECFVPGLTDRLNAIEDRLERQVEVMRFILNTYLHFPADRILRYEDTLADPQTQLGRLTPHVIQSPHPNLVPYDPIERYSATVDFARLAKAMLPISELVEQFYPGFRVLLKHHIG